MSQDTQYGAIPYVYRSKGLSARIAYDRCGEYEYIQLMNCLEREEEAMSSRYGTQIINRDPSGVGTNNYYFTSPVTSLARLNYLSSAYRYAGLQNGNLYRRTGNTQGAYTQIYTGLSGNTFQSLTTTCFETSQAFLFIYDGSASIKDTGLLSAPELTGIDPPPYTANAQPYSPLLIMIDSFATGNSYTTSNVTSWSWSNLETLTANSGQTITDFSEFFGIAQSGGGGTVYNPSPTDATNAHITWNSGTNSDTSPVINGWSSVSIAFGQTVNLIVNIDASASTTSGPGGCNFFADFQYSVNSGVTWTTFYTWTTSLGPSGSDSFGPLGLSVPITGISNLNTLQLQVIAGGTISGSISATISADINSSAAQVLSPGIFGIVTNGMVSILNTNTSISIPIFSVAASGLSGGIYTTLTVTTQTAHGLTTGNQIAVYGCSNDLVDGFYAATVLNSTQFTVPFESVVALSATGGNVVGGAAAPFACVLSNQYSTPYPSQMSAYGFYQQVPTTTTSFPIGAWAGTVAASTTGTVGKTVTLDLSQNNQVFDADLIVLALQIGSPNNVASVQLQFDVDGSGYTSAYYTASISPVYYQSAIAGAVSANQATQNQVLANSLGLLPGQQPIGSTTAQLSPSNFATGSGSWAAVLIPRGNFLPVGNAGQQGLNWANITGWRIVVTTNSGGSSTFACNGLYLQWGYGPSSFAGVGYEYRYTYYNANTGTESSPSPIMQFNQTYGYLSSLSAPFYLRQAAQVTGKYSSDSQVTHLRMYRRGGTFNDNWRQIDQVPNLTAGGTFIYKDVVADTSIQQTQTLVLDNDPPVTSTLINPIITALSAATSSPGQSIYSIYAPQVITVADSSATFVVDQTVLVGNAYNLEEVLVVAGGTGQFTSILRLQHNAGEQVQVNSIPRQHPTICALAYDQVWVVDPVNPSNVFRSKKGMPESFSPADYMPVGDPSDPVMALINWRGTLVAGTLKTWYIIANGATKPQPTGAVHGIVASNAWAQDEGGIWYRSVDGLRRFVGADGVYMSLPVEWVFQGNPLCLPPQALQSSISSDVMVFYNNQIIDSYISTAAGNPRYRMIYDLRYQRYRQDDVQATAMLWEKDINTLLVGKQISPGNYAVVQDQVGDYDDGGWVSGALVQTPINIAIQHPYRDLGKPHTPKQWNMLEGDYNTQNQSLSTTMLFEDGATSISLAAQNTGTTRQKCEMVVTGSSQPTGGGQQAYRASILHTMAVTTAHILYQEDVYAALVAEFNGSFDTYWEKFGTDQSKFVKQGYFDYTSPVALNVSLYADGSTTPYWTFTLPAAPNRAVQRVRFGNLNAGTTAFTMRTWRMVVLTTSVTNPLQAFQFWQKPRIEWKVAGNNSFQVKELEV